MRYYTAYGLIIQSEFECPELLALEDTDVPCDVVFRIGTVPEHLDCPLGRGVFYEADSERLLFKLDGVARYLARFGREIVVAPAGDVDTDVRVFLFSSVLGALLHQRGLLVLHASAIHTDRGAVIFTGLSGAGKSSTLSAMLERGYAMLCDDICALRLDERQRAVVLPAFPRTKLWKDVAELLGHDVAMLHSVRDGLEKFEVPTQHRFRTESSTVSRIYELQAAGDREELDICELGAGPGLGTIVRHTYRDRFLDGLAMRKAHFSLATALAQQVRTATVRRPTADLCVKELAERIEAHWMRDAVHA